MIDFADCQRLAVDARLAVRAAIEDGHLIVAHKSGPCWDCGRPAEQYDHRNYTKPLDVDPVCIGCNRRRGPAYPLSEFYKENGHPSPFRGKHILRAFKNGDRIGAKINQSPVAKSVNLSRLPGSISHWSPQQVERARNSLKRAIDIMGSCASLARALGITAGAVEKWQVCPRHRVDAVVEAIENHLSGLVYPDKYDLAPDVFGSRPTENCSSNHKGE